AGRVLTAPPAGAGRRAWVLAAAVLLAALTCLLFAPALDPDSVFYFRDVSQNHHPYRQLEMDMMREGEAPLWNPHRGAGQPLLANPNTLVLHPTTLLFFALPFEWAFKLSIIGQIFLAGLGTCLLLRDLGTSRAGSIVGASAFAFSGCLLSLGNLLNLLNSAAFMPLTLWLMGRAVRRGFAPWGSLAALSLTVQVLAGEPALLIVTALAFLALPSGTQGHAARSGLGWRAATVAGIVLLACALSMAGLLPGVEMLSRSERGAGFEPDEAMKWSLSPAALGEMVVRGLYGDPVRTSARGWWGGTLHDTGVPFLLSLYLGPGMLLLACAGFAAGWKRRAAARREAVGHAALGAIGLAFALGRFLPLYPMLWQAAPPLQSVRYPVKYALLLAWSVALLAARGYDHLAGRESRPRLRTAIAGSLAAGCASLVVWGTGLFGWTAHVAARAARAAAAPEHAGAIAARMDGALLEAGLVVAVLVAVILARVRPVSRIALAVIPVGMLMASGVKVNPVAPAGFYTQPPALLMTLQASGGGRLWAAPRPAGFAYRTPAGDEADSLVWGFLWDRMTLRNATAFPLGVSFAFDRGNERLDILPGAALGRDMTERARDEGISPGDLRLLSVGGVDRVLVYGASAPLGVPEVGRLEGRSNMPVRLLAVPGAVPRARAVTRFEVQPETDRALKRLQDPEFDPFTTVILEQDVPAPASDAAHVSVLTAAAHIVQESPTKVRIRASLPRPGHVVLADTWYPGWMARVDGRSAPVVRADGMFRAVPVAPGEHEIVFSYEPASVRSGLMVSAAALVLAGLLAVPRRRP
ncbi:MAG: YfhO family protein, partial [Candidatus Polarisedimenticolia bacterium]